MKAPKITTLLAAAAVIGGLAITTLCNGLAAFLGGFLLIYFGALTLLATRTNYIRNY